MEIRLYDELIAKAPEGLDKEKEKIQKAADAAEDRIILLAEKLRTSGRSLASCLEQVQPMLKFPENRDLSEK